MITSEGALIPAHAARPVAELVVRPTWVYLPQGVGPFCRCGSRLWRRVGSWPAGTYQCEACFRATHLQEVHP